MGIMSDITDDDILRLQARALRAEDWPTIYDCYTALGYGRQVPVPPLVGEIRIARRRCAVQLSRLLGAGVEL